MSFKEMVLKILNYKSPFSMEIGRPLPKSIYSKSIDEITSDLEKIID